MSYQALLFCPDEKTARVVTQVLTELDFTVEPCNETFAAVKKLMAQHFDAIVVDCENEQNATLLFKSARNSVPNQSSLSVAVVEGQSGVAKAFRIGANLVLTKPINVEQSKGTLRVARGLLRKADAGKPSVAAAPSQPIPIASVKAPARPVSIPSLSEKPAAPFAAASAPQTPGNLSSSGSGFEVEEDESPKPEPAEVALLESMPDPLASKSTSFNSKELPWQQVPAPHAAQDPKPVAEVSAKPAAEKSAPQPLGFGDSSRAKDLLALGIKTAASGSAAAPAPAKETLPPLKAEPKSAKTSELEVVPNTIATTAPVIEPPMFSALSVKDHEAGDQGGSKKPFLFVALAAIVIAGGYVGWTRYSHTPAPASTVLQPASQAKPVSAAPVSSSAAPSGGSTTASGDLSHVPVSSEASQANAADTTHSGQPGTMIASTSKPTPATKTPSAETIAADVTKTVLPESGSHPLVVKNNATAQSAPKVTTAEVAQPVAPGALGLGTNNDDKAIAGIMSSAPAIPKPAVQSVRISQGVSQGLLVKRVQPNYPSQAMQMRLQGAVLLDAKIGKDGSIVSIKRVSGDGVLARAAMDAVKQWKYKPYYLNGEPVEIDTQITVNFKLP
jgi:protein TonB